MALQTICRHSGLGALLLAASFGAHAQADYALYGVADFSYGRFEPSGQYREHRFASNSMTASFVGVNGKYGLDGGWTPGITLETFIRFEEMQTGRNDNDPLLSRNAFASLGSDYGTLRIGRIQTFLFDATTRFNALGNSVAFSPAVRQLFASGNLDGVQGDFYWDRAVSYQTPDLEGIRVNVMAAGGPSAARGDYYGISVIGSVGLLSGSVSAQRVHVDDGINDPTDENTWQFGLTYNFGFARLFGLYTQTDDRGLEVESNLASVGATVPIGPGNLLVQYGYTTAEGPAVDRKHTSFSAAYLYAWDSVTDFYLVGMDDRISGQTRGLSAALGVRYRF
jgi:predicted porin